MEIKGTPNKISATNQECVDSIELQMCKKILIETVKGKIELFQKTVKITLNGGRPVVYNPGDYPQPCSSSALHNVEIFSKGLFMIVRVFDEFNRFSPLYEVRNGIFTRIHGFM